MTKQQRPTGPPTGTAADGPEPAAQQAPDGAAPPEPGTGAETRARPVVGEDTVEAVIRGQLSKALGGKRGMLEGAVPTIMFTASYLLTQQVPLAVGLGVGAAVVLAVVRLVQRSSLQFVFNSLLGIAIAAVFALRSGEAEDAFLPGIIYNAVYAGVMILTIMARWPVVGLLIGSVTGDLTSWRDDPAILRLCSRLTWLLVAPCVIRVVVQYPLWLGGMVGWLGTAKIAMGWPLQVAAFAAMVWLLARNRTPMRAAAPSAPAP
ncbi:DUF3159 domain-containing protein [Allonocardiopsis opalescens]|uniref:Uncharacterized protein DUF3159 n=1 Tax=Allonocardiopsis opalescens TaxID=1144618 RepID=A0A2T0PU45_9ACTN|nr:DUF3159 domain-containing protein [Allonocardiopsis opalescens]PRX92421.1 uncharacterized protein DUF3159 [Allonocardiopsis opalescens]